MARRVLPATAFTWRDLPDCLRVPDPAGVCLRTAAIDRSNEDIPAGATYGASPRASTAQSLCRTAATWSRGRSAPSRQSLRAPTMSGSSPLARSAVAGNRQRRRAGRNRLRAGSTLARPPPIVTPTPELPMMLAVAASPTDKVCTSEAKRERAQPQHQGSIISQRSPLLRASARPNYGSFANPGHQRRARSSRQRR